MPRPGGRAALSRSVRCLWCCARVTTTTREEKLLRAVFGAQTAVTGDVSTTSLFCSDRCREAWDRAQGSTPAWLRQCRDKPLADRLRAAARAADSATARLVR